MRAAPPRPIQNWLRDKRGAALPEFALLFPLLVAMVMGSYDIGRAITINQKVISASQIIADLITRNQSVTFDDLSEIILAGEMALDPYSRDPLGYDIVSMRFDAAGTPLELWRVTDNMIQNDDVFERSVGLGLPGEGVVAVSVSYTYEPFFTGFLRDDINMREVAILRGRRTAAVSCPDC